MNEPKPASDINVLPFKELTAEEIAANELATAEREKKRAQEEAEKLKEQIYQATIKKTGIPARYLNSKIGNMVASCEAEQKNINRVVAYIKNQEYKNATMLVFLGSKGTGKTHLGCSMVHALVRENNYYGSSKRIPRYMTLVSMIRSIQDTYGHASQQTTTEVMDALKSSDLLVIDEIGAQRGTKEETLYLYEVLRDRHAELKPSILISNLSEADFKHQVGSLIMDRIEEDNGEILISDWPSHRGKK